MHQCYKALACVVSKLLFVHCFNTVLLLDCSECPCFKCCFWLHPLISKAYIIGTGGQYRVNSLHVGKFLHA